MNTRPTCAAFAGALLLVMAGCASSASSASSATSEPSASSTPAAPAAGPVCTPGMDQTCNDDEAISSLHGACRPDGTCECKPEFAKNEATGRCK